MDIATAYSTSMATKRAAKHARRREKLRQEVPRAFGGSLAHLLERDTHDKAAAIVEKTPPTMFGLRRGTFLLLAAGAADFVGQLAGSGSEVADDLAKAKATLGLAGMMSLVLDGPAPSAQPPSPPVVPPRARSPYDAWIDLGRRPA